MNKCSLFLLIILQKKLFHIFRMCKGQYYMTWRSMMEHVEAKDVINHKRLTVFYDDIRQSREKKLLNEVCPILTSCPTQSVPDNFTIITAHFYTLLDRSKHSYKHSILLIAKLTILIIAKLTSFCSFLFRSRSHMTFCDSIDGMKLNSKYL